MSKIPEFRITDKDPTSILGVMTRIIQLVTKGLDDGPVVVQLTRDGKSRAQECKYHAMISDIAKHCTAQGVREASPDAWKTLLVEQFEQELQIQGAQLNQPGHCIISLDGRRVVQVRPSTASFRKSEARDFVEYLYATGTEYGVAWSEPALAAYEFYREAQSA